MKSNYTWVFKYNGFNKVHFELFKDFHFRIDEPDNSTGPEVNYDRFNQYWRK